MALSRFVESKFGMKTRSVTNPVTVTVATSKTLILKNNPDRLAWTLINLTAYSIYVAFDGEVSTSRGILVPPSGGSLTLTAEEDGELVGYEVFAISATAASTIFIIITEGE